MALPLKSGADLYNQQALRLRLHNLGADPLEVGEGLIYYNTSTGLNTSGKARIYTGAGWKTLAFSEDLDVASNADFLALKEKVELLAGDVDTDAIISNMKEVAAFLDGFAEDADLMTYLNTELGKKLDKTGGTISNRAAGQALTIHRSNINYDSMISFSNDTDGLLGRIGISGTYNNQEIAPRFYKADGTTYTLLHSGNYSSYALPIDGSAMMAGALHLERRATGTVNVGSNDGLFLYRGPGTGGVDIGLPGDYYNLLNIGASGTYSNLQLSWYRSISPSIFARAQDGDKYGAWKEFAFTDSNVASATKLQTARTIWGQSFDGTDDIVNPATMSTLRFRNTDGTSTSYIGRAATSNNDIFLYIPTANNFHIATNGVERMLINASGGVTIGSSDLAGTGKYFNVQNVFSVNKRSSDAPASVAQLCVTEIGGSKNGIHMYVDSNSASTKRPLILQYGDNYGNVLIGTTNDNGAKLQVNGVVKTKDSFIIDRYGDHTYWANGFYIRGEEDTLWGIGAYSNDKATEYYYIGGYGSEMITIRPNGNVGIGTTSPSEKLSVAGNITATGEISCGGAGEEGVGGGGASVYQHVFTPSASPSVTVLHNLGTEDIVITLYEKDAASGLWSVCLTDIEIVSANEINIAFGSTSSQEHKVVIMGGAA